jgi:hypothetical protein
MPHNVCNNAVMKKALFIAGLLAASTLAAQTVPTPPLQPILPGGQVLPLFPPDSKYIKKERIGEPEQYNMMKGVPGRLQSIADRTSHRRITVLFDGTPLDGPVSLRKALLNFSDSFIGSLTENLMTYAVGRRSITTT